VSRRKHLIRDLAKQRALYLISLAEKEVREGNISLSRKYCELALTILKRTRAKIPRYIKRKICKNCQVVLIPSLTSTIRIRGSRRSVRIITRCKVCGWIHRLEYRKGKQYEET